MAIKGGDAIFVGGDTVVLDRLQTAGPGQLNIPTEKIYELGNYKSVAVIRDTPDLSFSMESYDVSTEVEEFLCGAVVVTRSLTDGVSNGTTLFTSATAAFLAAEPGALIRFTTGTDAGKTRTIVTRSSGTNVVLSSALAGSDTGVHFTIEQNAYDVSLANSVDISTQFKPGKNKPSPFNIIGSVTVPFLTLESISYRFGLKQDARQSYGLRGDSIFYNYGSAITDYFNGDASTVAFATTQEAYAYTDGSGTRRALAVIVDDVRLTYGADYTCASGSITAGHAIETVTFTVAPAVGVNNIRILYSTSEVITYDQTVHALATVKPAAIRGRDIDVYINGYTPDLPSTSAANKFTDVQSVQMDWRVTLDKDEEFGNYYYVAQDFDVPAVTGTVALRPRNPLDLYTKLREITGTTLYESVGPNVADPLAIDIILKDGANAGATLKRLHSGDVRFSVPGFSMAVQAKMEISLPFESDSGELLIYKV